MGFKVKGYGLPKGCYVVPFGVCYGFLLRGYTILAQAELHCRFWVVTLLSTIYAHYANPQTLIPKP